MRTAERRSVRRVLFLHTDCFQRCQFPIRAVKRLFSDVPTGTLFIEQIVVIRRFCCDSCLAETERN
jgi:hypothetical protein